MPRRETLPLVEQSFLRRADPRTKLALSCAASAAVMLPLPELVVFAAFYLALAAAAGVARHAAALLARIGLLLCVLFAVDWLFIGFEFAVLISVRLALLVTAFSLVFATTTPDELRIALEHMRVPQRLAFTFATAYCSLALVESEWHGVLEAQQARGLLTEQPGGWSWRSWQTRLASSVSLLVPVVVLVTQRAWALNEAAAVRGLESPQRRPYRRMRLAAVDALLLGGTAALLIGLFACR